MKKKILQNMNCPYCLNSFEIEKIVEGTDDRIIFGLIRCRCFSFPIVHGVLLLGLTKGYGGSEEHVQPYVPLQVAAIEYLRADQLDQLHRWIRRHVPLLADLVETPELTYTEFMRAYSRRLAGPVQKDLYSDGRYEVLGKAGAVRKKPSLKAKLGSTRIGAGYVSLRERLSPKIFNIWYLKRYTQPGQIMQTRAIIRTLPFDGPILSLCCGHGILEFLISGIDATAHDRTVCIDGQLLNLFVVRKFIAPSATYICHDVQFPLPFQSGSFDSVFSSSCLSEIPARATFVRESSRVTSENGWCLFDSVTEAASEDDRINPSRYWRYCQNEMTRLTEYFELIRKCVESKDVQIMVVKGDKVFHEAELTRIQEFLEGKITASFLVANAQSQLIQSPPPSFDFLTDLERNRLYLNPRFDRYRRTGDSSFEYILEENGKSVKVNISDATNETNLKKLLERSQLVLLPEQFAPNLSDRKVIY